MQNSIKTSCPLAQLNSSKARMHYLVTLYRSGKFSRLRKITYTSKASDHTKSNYLLSHV